ncbi:L-gulonolactone/D-arabinono-1,4-lactone oxidase [Patellaria atrata CBS 101060]|uniref:D-arabinono-1,4-lactone oxidase n=1 Tax=Patellaria atrata CBS 101060 TaxID=1346257 RepID=A0A9P4SJ92_9PEZI|nr:L-gulonolactone/D-arabinono-1,4-lactone oxidase [Patellaria atrata CBS 101060]
MASRLEAELHLVSPEIPFRASSNYAHHTWARTFHSYPELYLRPQTLLEIQKIVTLAKRCRRRIVVVGSGHSPSDLTCTSSWLVNLDDFAEVLGAEPEKKRITVQGGIRLRDLNLAAKEYGLTMRNLGSIDEQSIVGAISTATHGSSLEHGLMSQSVKSLRIVLANGQVVSCSESQNTDLFRAALVSLGALGIIVEVEFELITHTNIEWTQTLFPLDDVLTDWESTLWRSAEFTRVWWLPYMKRAIVWRAVRTDKPPRPPMSNWYGGSIGYHTYHILLWMSNYVPRILPAIEWFVFGMQYGFKDYTSTTGVEEMRTGLLMNCLYSQFVNEWALPLHKGPETITRLSAWLNGEPESKHRIPFSARGLYVHCPVEVRVSDTTTAPTRAFLDNTVEDGPTLYLNATLYRPYLQDPPCRERYYEAFEWLMKEMGAKPHWAKNFSTVTQPEIHAMFGTNLTSYLRVRNEVDPDGQFVGPWHRRYILPADSLGGLPIEEREVNRRPAKSGGVVWYGEQAPRKLSPTSSGSELSFDLMAGAEAESTLLNESDYEYSHVEHLTHGSHNLTYTGTEVFNKM